MFDASTLPSLRNKASTLPIFGLDCGREQVPPYSPRIGNSRGHRAGLFRQGNRRELPDQ